MPKLYCASATPWSAALRYHCHRLRRVLLDAFAPRVHRRRGWPALADRSDRRLCAASSALPCNSASRPGRSDTRRRGCPEPWAALSPRLCETSSPPPRCFAELPGRAHTSCPAWTAPWDRRPGPMGGRAARRSRSPCVARRIVRPEETATAGRWPNPRPEAHMPPRVSSALIVLTDPISRPHAARLFRSRTRLRSARYRA